MRSLRARLLALITALAVLLPAGALARAHYFCRMMGRTMSSCCCAAKHRKASAARAPELRARGCCERIAPSSGHEAMQSATEAAPPVPPAALVRVLPGFEQPAPLASLAPEFEVRARGPPELGPPLFILHCSLLS